VFELKRDARTAEEIANFLKAELNGSNCVVCQPCSLDELKDNSVLWVGKPARDHKYDLSRLDAHSEMLVILWRQFPGRPDCSYILSDEPRLDFARVLNEFFVTLEKPYIHPTAIIQRGAAIGRDVLIGAYTYVGPKVRIGDNCRIYHNVSILGDVRIGSGCVVKSNAAIGSEAFGFVMGRDGLVHFPQTGRIIVGDNVWIGSNSTIERAAIDATVIENEVKIDDLVQIGHNTMIGSRSLICAGVIICGRARVGGGAWIAPNATISNAVTVGDGAYVGLGAVVIRDVDPGIVVVGNPARFLKKRGEAETDHPDSRVPQ
jgi:UDP-3-O-[3-hydroxymyristoyl] glucosamine N-acyltransferase